MQLSNSQYNEMANDASAPSKSWFNIPKAFVIGGLICLIGQGILELYKATGFEKDEAGNVTKILCTADLETGNGMPADGRKVRGTIHWVSTAHAVDAEVRLYGDLFGEENMGELPEGKTYDDYLNPESVQVLPNAKLEPALKDARPGERFQFVRMGYFTPDSKHPGVYNRIVTLKDSFSKTLTQK